MLELGIKAGREQLYEQWKSLRRGWYLGNESFRQKLDRWLERAVSGRKRQCHSGGAIEARDAAAAERFLARGLAPLELKEQDLADLPKTAPEKVALAWWLRGRPTASLVWVSERLRTGHYTRVTQALSRMIRKPGKELRALRDTLLATNGEGEQVAELSRL